MDIKHRNSGKNKFSFVLLGGLVDPYWEREERDTPVLRTRVAYVSECQYNWLAMSLPMILTYNAVWPDLVPRGFSFGFVTWKVFRLGLSSPHDYRIPSERRHEPTTRQELVSNTTVHISVSEFRYRLQFRLGSYRMVSLPQLERFRKQFPPL